MLNWLIPLGYIIGFVLTFRRLYRRFLNSDHNKYGFDSIDYVPVTFFALLWPIVAPGWLVGKVLTSGIKSNQQIWAEQRQREMDLHLKENDLKIKAHELGLPWPK